MRLTLNNELLVPGNDEAAALTPAGFIAALPSRSGGGDACLSQVGPIGEPEYRGGTFLNDTAPSCFAIGRNRIPTRLPKSLPEPISRQFQPLPTPLSPPHFSSRKTAFKAPSSLRRTVISAPAAAPVTTVMPRCGRFFVFRDRRLPGPFAPGGGNNSIKGD